jgi:ketosteroid isomerase-like protein
MAPTMYARRGGRWLCVAAHVRIRIFGDVALIHARTTYKKPNGEPAAGRYTDVWARQGGGWLCVAAHVTRG